MLPYGVSRRIKTIGVVGGGTAGYFAAIALKRAFPERSVTVIESSKIPVIGVGEATTPPLVPFLHDVLGIDVHRLVREVRPTWKLGIRFEWGRATFNYPFAWGHVHEAYAYDRDLARASLPGMLMQKRRVPIFEHEGRIVSLLDKVPFAYHLDNAPFVSFLQRHASTVGVERLDRTIVEAVPRERDGIDALRTEDGEQLAYDFYVDCSGFRSLILERTLGSPFQSYGDSLYCDTAIIASVPHVDDIHPYTRAETMNAGWCWAIPQVDEVHRGYVFASRWLSVEQAIDEMRVVNPGMSEIRGVIPFRSGRHREFCIGNVAAVGNSYGFVEPLESTALHMVILEVTRLVALLDPANEGSVLADPDELNSGIGAHWDYLRWFLALHYRFNHNRDTPFWRHCHTEVDVSGLAEQLAELERQGPLSSRSNRSLPDAIFGPGGFDVLALGQGARCADVTPAMSRESWDQLCRGNQELVDSAVGHRRALEIIEEQPAILDQLLSGPWCTSWGGKLHAPRGSSERLSSEKRS